MFQLTSDEAETLRCQIGISNEGRSGSFWSRCGLNFKRLRYNPGTMHKPFLIAGLLLGMTLITASTGSRATPSLEKAEMRCGWFSNPTPANASLFDREGEWIISVQGGYQAEGDWPTFGPKQKIKTNV